MTSPVNRRLLQISGLTAWTVVVLGVGYLVGVSMPDQGIAKASTSPDGRFGAFVRAHPSIDPPNQSLWIKNNASGKVTQIAKLPEDVDGIQDIRWAPDSEVVVFNTYWCLYCLRVADGKTKKIEKEATKRQGWDAPRELEDITFGTDASFSYQYAGESEPVVVTFDS